MKKRMMKSFLATALLAGSILGQVGFANAATAKPTVAPVMTDNLAKYGLKKAMNLPVTLTSEGLSYTLHKIMIYDFQSAEVKNLQKLYGFQSATGSIGRPKYLIWTKFTLQNNTKKIMTGGGNDIKRLMPFTFQTGKITDPIWPRKLASKTNSTEALWTFTLKPGEKITSYLAYAYADDFDYFVMRLYYGKNFVEKYVVPE
ncbi:hypothetical protein [Paenibacillus monticola]|uniref:DUF4879 domain-containing protein n=1 Tax=Paenibacillus monticola TaxID=2666075 RepID=A0A7X2H1H2_9BACL|nr:hypothetical protein [Paenibacillus monticola]MRN51812.1 hypothetical protein [Paenibacillus monticola]